MADIPTTRFDLSPDPTDGPLLLLSPHPASQQSTPYGVAFDPANGVLFVAQTIDGGQQLAGETAPVDAVTRARRGDLAISRLALDGTVTGTMYARGMGQGVTLSCEAEGAETYLWLEADAALENTVGIGQKIGRMLFVNGGVVDSGGPDVELFDPIPGARNTLPVVDLPTGRIAIRYVPPAPSSTRWYRVFDLAEFKAGNFTTPLYDFAETGVRGAFQSFTLFGQYIYIHEGTAYGAGNAPPGNHYIVCVDLAGRLIERVFQGIDPTLDHREPKALTVYYGAETKLVFGYSVNNPRELTLYSLPLIPLPATPPVIQPPLGGTTDVSVPPAPSVAPAVSIAMRTPFAVDHTGRISFTDDEYEILLDRVHALVGTLPGERVMRATYGVPTSQALFMPAQDADAMLQFEVQQAVSRWESSATVSRIDSTVNHHLGLVSLQVQVSRSDTPEAEDNTAVRRVEVAVGGAVTSTPQ